MMIEQVGYINFCSLVIAPVGGVNTHVVRWRTVSTASYKMRSFGVMYHMYVGHMKGMCLEVVKIFKIAGSDKLDAHHMRITIVVTIPGNILRNINTLCPHIVDSIAKSQESIRISLDFFYGSRIAKCLAPPIRRFERSVESHNILSKRSVELRSAGFAVIPERFCVPAVPTRRCKGPKWLLEGCKGAL